MLISVFNHFQMCDLFELKERKTNHVSQTTELQLCQNFRRVIENALQIFTSVIMRGLALFSFIIAYNADEDTPLRIASLFKLIPDSSHNALILSAINVNVSVVSMSKLQLSRDNHAVDIIGNQRGGST